MVVPEAVVVEVDGGRIRTRAAGATTGVHDPQNKEDKIACLATLSGPAFTADPCPEPPDALLCPRRVQRLVAQVKGISGEVKPQQPPGEPADPQATSAERGPTRRWSPERLVRTCVASLETSCSFGPLVAAEARQRHSYQAQRRAFVADGAAYNWSIHEGYFRDFEPVVDLLHGLCYVHSSARAVSADEPGGWSRYLGWLRACWQGRVAEVLVELDRWQERLGLPPSGEARSAEDRSDPRRVVWEARSYLGNNRERMDYPRYRREGLPTTSSLVESLVGEFNARVKAKQKHWCRPSGAESILQLRAAFLSAAGLVTATGHATESILQLRAAFLSQDDRLGRFFANRPGCPFRKRPAGHKRADHHPVQTTA